jgi:hypothetical protein
MAVVQDLKAVLQVEDKNFQSRLKNAEKQTNKFSESMKRMGTAIAGAFAVNAVKNFLVESAKLADTQLKAEASLLTALGGREDAQKRLIRQAQELQKITLFGDEVTIQAQAMLAQMGLNEKQITDIIPKVQDLATGLNMDLVSAAQLVGKSIATSTNALMRNGVEINGVAGSSERLASAMDALDAKFKGQAETAAKTGLGPLIQLKMAIDDVREEMVKGFIPAIQETSTALKELLPQAFEVIKDSIAEVEKSFKDFFSMFKVEGDATNIILKGITLNMTILKTTLVAVAEVLSLLFKNIITIFSTVGNVFGSIIDTIKGIGAAIVAVVNRDWDALNNAVDDTGVGILNVTQSIVSGFEELGDNFSTFGKNMADNLINSYQAVFGEGMQKVEEDLGEAGDEAGKAFVDGFTMRLQEMGSVGVISALAPAAITAKDSMMGLKNALNLVNVEMLTLEQMGERIGKVIMDLSEPIKMFGSQAIGGLADAFGSAIAGGENFGASILSIFGGFMKQLGQLMIGTAISAQKFMATLLVPGPAALAAGIALVALGSAFTKKASGMTQSMGSGGGGGSASTSMGGRGMSTDVTRLAGPPVNIEGEFQIRGRDLVMVLEKTNYSNTKTRG